MFGSQISGVKPSNDDNYASNCSQKTDSIRQILQDTYQRFNYGDVLNAMRDTQEIETERNMQRHESEEFGQYLSGAKHRASSESITPKEETYD